MTSTHKYKLKLDLRVLDHLGIKLYSNAAAVLSEAVANSWDADAKLVAIDIRPDEDLIRIEDDGRGMDLAEVNDRFLSVGYDKRKAEGEKSVKGRPYMGRKGIGKLALFSIAGVIEVHTKKGGETNSFRMVTDDVKAAVGAGDDYYPTPIPFTGPSRGTRLVLSALTKKRTTQSIEALRKRVARRFSIIGYRSNTDRFDVKVNGKAIGPKDREDLKAVEFLWEFGGKHIPDADLPSVSKRFVLPSKVAAGHPDWRVSGWLGAAEGPKMLRHEHAGGLNGIVVLSRGRLIQENVLDRLGYSRILVSYLTGQVQADFLDQGDEDDIATSDRQRLVEDDPRYEALTTFLHKALVSIQDKWTTLRNEARGKQAIAEIPALKDWIGELPTSQRDNAERLLGLIRGVELEDESQRKELYRSGMLAFERLRLREQAHLLTGSSMTAATLLPLLADLETLEGSLYREIVKVRLDVIREFENLVDADEKEKLLQKHLFNNLWLLDPGWERAAGSERIEQNLKKDYAAFKPTLTDAQSKGRVDIKYRTNADQHIIVELKRAKRTMKVGELIDQGDKYLTALQECLSAEGKENPHISIVFVVGKPIAEEGSANGKRKVKELLAAINARAVHYETLIAGARASYDEYLKRSAKVDKLDKILKKLA